MSRVLDEDLRRDVYRRFVQWRWTGERCADHYEVSSRTFFYWLKKFDIKREEIPEQICQSCGRPIIGKETDFQKARKKAEKKK